MNPNQSFRVAAIAPPQLFLVLTAAFQRER
jgi:hypothetical protein